MGRSPEAAVNAIDSILDAIASLTEFGDRGAPGDPPGTRNLFIPFGRGAYALNYRADDHEVVVARIFHSLEDRPLA